MTRGVASAPRERHRRLQAPPRCGLDQKVEDPFPMVDAGLARFNPESLNSESRMPQDSLRPI